MLDYRLKTFLLLSKTLNYTKTAQQLHMSQPAVSQHIRYLSKPTTSSFSNIIIGGCS